ncbi:MAG: hypothetical protein AAF384_12185 [Pseudomonadota bacterium]
MEHAKWRVARTFYGCVVNIREKGGVYPVHHAGQSNGKCQFHERLFPDVSENLAVEFVID